MRFLLIFLIFLISCAAPAAPVPAEINKKLSLVDTAMQELDRGIRAHIREHLNDHEILWCPYLHTWYEKWENEFE